MAKEKNIKSDYGAKSIQVLEGLDPVRKRPGMYIGGTSTEGLHHLIWEIVNNSIDEALAGRCDEITVKLLPDNVVSVSDNGAGIPVEIHPQTKKSTLETVLTVLHAGGKFGGDGYKVSGGLHGVGVSVVNALSEWTKVEVKREGKLWVQEYKRGKPQGQVKPVGKATETGTTVIFKADSEIFPEIKYSWTKILDYVRQQAYLTKGVKIIIEDSREVVNENESYKIKKHGFFFDGGIISFVKFLNRGKEIKNTIPFYFEKTVDDVQVELSLQYTAGFKEHLYSFTNNIYTVEGGTHVTGFKMSLTRVLNDYAKKNNLIKEKEGGMTSDDLKEGLTAVVSVKMRDPQFEGQTKSKLGNAEVRGVVSSITSEGLGEYLEKNPQDARAIIDKCMLTVRARIAARAAKDAVLRKGALEGMTLPGKLADCSTRDASRSELYIVEGDSAGGCFEGNTKIALTDGRNLSFFELIDEEKKGIQNYCYTLKKDGSIGIEKIKNVRKTKSAAEVIKVTLDNNEELICTPDHLFMLKNGEYKQAEKLTKKDSLMPLYRQFSKIGKRITIEGYELVFDPAQARWIFTHLLADKYNLEKGFYQKNNGSHKHHIDFNKLNNNPNNLIRLEKEEHLELHRKCAKETLQRPDVLEKLSRLRKTKEYREKIRKIMLQPKMRKMLSERAKKQWEDEVYKKFMVDKFLEFYNTDADYREKNNELLNKSQKKYWSVAENKQTQSEKIKAYFKKNSKQKKQLSELAKKQWQDSVLLDWRKVETKKQWTDEFREKRKNAYNQTYLQKALKVLHAIYKSKNKVDKDVYAEKRKKTNDKSLIKYETICERFFGGSEEKLFDAVVHFNHKIKSIEKINRRIDVYDLEVPNTHNFALASGIFVHNSAKQGRNRQFQAILPLRGKLVNVEKTSLDKVVKSDTLKPIIIALGTGIGETFDASKIRYGKIIIMADADVDGSHIRTLLLTFFYRYFEELITNGNIYIAQPPLYRIQKGKDVRWVYTDEQKDVIVEEFKAKAAEKKNAKGKMGETGEMGEVNGTGEMGGEELTQNEIEEAGGEVEKIAGVTIQRYKGLGEMNPQQLWDTTMNPETRLMYKVNIEDAEEADRIFDILMGSDVEPRRRFIQTHAKSVKNLDV